MLWLKLNPGQPLTMSHVLHRKNNEVLRQDMLFTAV